MTRAMLLLLLTLLIYRNTSAGGTLYGGNEEGLELEEIAGPETNYPEGDSQVKSESYELFPKAGALSWPGRPNICYFIHQGRLESQLSCHLRFTRRKFNFNPFGLRFGKRARDNANAERQILRVSRQLLPHLLKLKDKWIKCGEGFGETC
ncbi:hypothetical protein XELAEV_18019697mg [Xenopus laevis]|uniref:Kisspeptin n=1 Tax=Xenopus laevis TaxID=8355 RepID=A0A974D5G7_XENLA|nr:hypothetical protein XELAEV_18019697mg [Xenopus laevis]